MIQRIELLFEYDSKNRPHFCLNTTQWIDPIFFECDSIEILVEKNVKKLFFLIQKIELFFTWLLELNFFFFFNMTQRIEPFIIWLKELSFFLTWRNALNLFPVCRKEFIESHLKTRKVQFFESARKTSILFVILKRSSNRWVKSYFLKKKVQFRESYKKGSILWVISEKKSWILWVVLKNFNSSSRIQKKKKFTVEKKSHFQKNKFNSVSRIEKIQFCESYSYLKKFERSILRVIFWKEKYFEKKVQVCES